MKALFFILNLLIFSLPASAKLLEKISAQAGDEIISLIDLTNFRTQLNEGLIPSSFLLDSLYEGPSKLLKNQSEHLNYLVDWTLIQQKISAGENLEKISADKLSQELKKIQRGFSPAQFLRKLRRAGFTSLQSYKSFLRKNQQINLFLIKKLLPKAVFSDQEIESAFFEAYKKKLFYHFEYEFLSVSFNKDKKEPALKALKQKSSSKDLETLAKSLGLNSKLSQLKASEIDPNIKKELDRLSISQISPLLFIDSSYYLLQLRWKTPLIDPKDNQKKAEIEKKLIQEKLKQELKQWIQTEKSQSFVKITASL